MTRARLTSDGRLAAVHVDAFLAAYDRLDAALVAAGFPPTSPWWRAQLERFMRSGRRRWVIRAGRRAGKSSTLCRLAVAWALWGSWAVPPGDVAVIAFVSIDRDEAGARLRTIATILRTLGVAFAERGDELELPERSVVFRVVTCSIRGVVGFTSIAVFEDEMARWESRDPAANPAREVSAGLRPTMATQPTAFEVAVSSPWGTDDYHAELYDAGDTDHQVTSFGATWECNPTISEAATHDFEPDPRIWSREYAAVPGATVSAALDSNDIGATFARQLLGSLAGGFVTIDASSLRGDAFTWIAGRETDQGELAVLEVGGWEGEELRHVSMATIVETIANKAKEHGARRVFGDQREEAALRELFAQQELQLVTFAWSEPSKDESVMLLRRMMREAKLSLCEHATMRRELTSMKARLVPSGRTRYETNGLDYASALITLMHAAVAGETLGVRTDWSKIREIHNRLSRRPATRWSGMPGRGF